MHLLSASLSGRGEGEHQAVGVRIGGVVQNLQQIQALKVVEIWGLRFMANQLREIVGTLLPLKKEDIGSQSSFQKTWQTKKRGYVNS